MGQKANKERNYTTTKIVKSRRTRKSVLRTFIAKGLKLVHIGENIWKFGKQSYVNGKLHMVIYGPNRKEYHVWGNDVKELSNSLYDEEWGSYFSYNRHGNSATSEEVKKYILTSILDKRENWCFDLHALPAIGSKQKVLYNNGTIKNIIFDGKFKVELTEKYKNKLIPVAYRLN